MCYEIFVHNHTKQGEAFQSYNKHKTPPLSDFSDTNLKSQSHRESIQQKYFSVHVVPHSVIATETFFSASHCHNANEENRCVVLPSLILDLTDHGHRIQKYRTAHT